MLRFWRVTSENLKNRESYRYSGNYKFSGVIFNELPLKVKLIWKKNFFLRGLITKKTRGRAEMPPSYKIGSSSLKPSTHVAL